MPTQLTAKHWEDFWITCYFGRPEGKVSIASAVERAYLDFCRTLRGFASNSDHDALYTGAREELLERLDVLCGLAQGMKRQSEFDLWHEETCLALKAKMPGLLTVGQAQKWVNMSLKYIVALGEKRVPGYAPIQDWCHVPLDSIVLEALGKRKCPVFDCAWSRLDDYARYRECQEWIREHWPESTGLEVEYKLWQGDPDS